MGTTRDIAILGSGPAALSIGAAAARLGCDVTVIAPNPDAPWAPTYCLWEAELPANLAGTVEHRWPSAVVATDRRERVLDRAYVKLDGPSLASTLWHDLRTASARIVNGAAISLAHDDERSIVSTDAGTKIAERFVALPIRLECREDPHELVDHLVIGDQILVDECQPITEPSPSGE